MKRSRIKKRNLLVMIMLFLAVPNLEVDQVRKAFNVIENNRGCIDKKINKKLTKLSHSHNHVAAQETKNILSK